MPRSAKKMSHEEVLLREMKAVLQRVRGRMDDLFAPSGMTTAQLHMLHQITLAETQSQRVSGADVARLCGVTPQTVQTALARAEKAEWVTRGASPDNERLVLWRLTRRGRLMMRKAEQTFDEILKQAWSGISRERQEALRDTLRQMLDNLEDN